MSRKPHCIVIGAGLAGLAAGYRLSEKGWKVTIYEASGRTGGRVLSHTFHHKKKKLVCELGGEWIGEDHLRMLRLCNELELDTEPHSFSEGFWYGRGLLRPAGEWAFKFSEKKFERFGEQFREWDKESDSPRMEALDKLSWWQKLDELGFKENDLLKRDWMDSTDFGESIRFISAYVAAAEYFAEVDSETDETDYKIKGGNEKLPKKLARKIRENGGRIARRSPVSEIHQSKKGVTVFIGRRKKPHHADYCICAAPAHAVATIKWKPDLPSDQRDAARQLQYARILKTAILYDSRFWRRGRADGDEGFSMYTNRISDFTFESTFGQELSPRDPGVLCSYAIGDKADDLAYERDTAKVKEWLSEDVALAVGFTKTQAKKKSKLVRGFQRQPWQGEKFIRGAYAFYRPGQWFTVRPLLAQRHQRVVFAGEHLSEDWQGFMEGAVETGEKAATRVVQLSDRKP